MFLAHRDTVLVRQQILQQHLRAEGQAHDVEHRAAAPPDDRSISPASRPQLGARIERLFSHGAIRLPLGVRKDPGAVVDPHGRVGRVPADRERHGGARLWPGDPGPSPRLGVGICSAATSDHRDLPNIAEHVQRTARPSASQQAARPASTPDHLSPVLASVPVSTR